DVSQPLRRVQGTLGKAQGRPHLLLRCGKPAAVEKDAVAEEVLSADLAAKLAGYFVSLEHVVQPGDLDDLVGRGHPLIRIVLLNRELIGHHSPHAFPTNKAPAARFVAGPATLSSSWYAQPRSIQAVSGLRRHRTLLRGPRDRAILRGGCPAAAGR